MSVKAAVNYGRCQACDRLQKLPNDVLAKHGYQVAMYGYFAGVCKGSAHSPYEEDCSWIKNFLIPQAQAEEKRLIEFVSELRLHVTEPKGWHLVYTIMGSIWNRLDVLGAPEHKYPVIKTGITKYNPSGVEPCHRFTWLPNIYEATPEALLIVAQAMNEHYAKHVEQYEIRRIRRYIEWQQARVANWKVRPLMPVSLVKDAKKRLEKEFYNREAAFVAKEYQP